jgi:hypothetical protein
MLGAMRPMRHDAAHPVRRPWAGIATLSILAAIGVACLAQRAGTDTARPAGAQRLPALGAGSPAALPFGPPGADTAGPFDAASPWARALASSDAVPAAVAALGGEPVHEALDRLRQLARGGDAQAASDAFEIAQFCADAGAFGRALPALPVTTQPQLKAELEARTAQQQRACEAATPAQLAARFEDVRIAAEAGVKGAAVRLLDAAPPGTEAGDATAGAWTQHAVALAERDAIGGDVGALTALGNAYESGGPVERDPTRALLYQLAAVEIMQAQPQQYSAGEVELQQQFAAGYAGEVPDAMRDPARIVARQIAQHCCGAQASP